MCRRGQMIHQLVTAFASFRVLLFKESNMTLPVEVFVVRRQVYLKAIAPHL